MTTDTYCEFFIPMSIEMTALSLPRQAELLTSLSSLTKVAYWFIDLARDRYITDAMKRAFFEVSGEVCVKHCWLCDTNDTVFLVKSQSVLLRHLLSASIICLPLHHCFPNLKWFLSLLFHLSNQSLTFCFV